MASRCWLVNFRRAMTWGRVIAAAPSHWKFTCVRRSICFSVRLSLKPTDRIFIDAPALNLDRRARLTSQTQCPLVQSRDRGTGMRDLSGIELELGLNVRPGEEQDRSGSAAESLVQHRDLGGWILGARGDEGQDQHEASRSHCQSMTHDPDLSSLHRSPSPPFVEGSRPPRSLYAGPDRVGSPTAKTVHRTCAHNEPASDHRPGRSDAGSSMHEVAKATIRYREGSHSSSPRSAARLFLRVLAAQRGSPS